jgi:predicted nucleotidyltransferase
VVSQTALQTIVETLDRALPLDALWLFGSEANGRANAQSDIDLAALFRTPPSSREILDVGLQLEAQLGRNVDLIDLATASPILVMQVLRNGKLTFERDRSRRVRFVATAPVRYEDLLRVRRPIENALRVRLVRG